MSSRNSRPVSFAGLAAVVAIGAAILVFLIVAAAMAVVHPSVNREARHNTVTVGGLQYSINNAWILNPHRAVDRTIAQGLPARDRHLRAGEALYAVFLGVDNPTGRARPMASDLALRDLANREYAPTPIARGNPYAYEPSVLAAGAQLPASDSPAGRDISADGLMLVFRIPRSSYENGPLQLLVHDPAHPDSVWTVQAA
jgi:hypothetical protein